MSDSSHMLRIAILTDAIQSYSGMRDAMHTTPAERLLLELKIAEAQAMIKELDNE